MNEKPKPKKNFKTKIKLILKRDRYGSSQGL